MPGTFEMIAIAGFLVQMVVYVVTVLMVFNKQKSQNERLETELGHFTNALKTLESEHDKLRDEVHKDYITDDKYREDLQRIWNRIEKLSENVNGLGRTMEKELRGFAEILIAELAKMSATK